MLFLLALLVKDFVDGLRRLDVLLPVAVVKKTLSHCSRHWLRGVVCRHAQALASFARLCLLTKAFN